MTFIDEIKNWCDSEGYTFRYGNPMQLEEMLGRVDFASSKDSTVVFCHLVTAMEWRNGRDRHTIGVYFARLCPFDFDGMQVLAQQEEMKDAAKSWLRSISCGNQMCWEDARFTFGYDDFCENVAWVCCRVTLWPAFDECVPMCYVPEPQEDFVAIEGMPKAAIDSMLGGDVAVTICPLAAIFDAGDSYLIAVMWVAKEEAGEAGVVLNGIESNANCNEIDEEVVSHYQDLAQYAGWYLYGSANTYELSAGDAVHIKAISDGEEVLSCSGQIPE